MARIMPSTMAMATLPARKPAALDWLIWLETK